MGLLAHGAAGRRGQHPSFSFTGCLLESTNLPCQPGERATWASAAGKLLGSGRVGKPDRGRFVRVGVSVADTRVEASWSTEGGRSASEWALTYRHVVTAYVVRRPSWGTKADWSRNRWAPCAATTAAPTIPRRAPPRGRRGDTSEPEHTEWVLLGALCRRD